MILNGPHYDYDYDDCAMMMSTMICLIKMIMVMVMYMVVTVMMCIIVVVNILIPESGINTILQKKGDYHWHAMRLIHTRVMKKSLFYIYVLSFSLLFIVWKPKKKWKEKEM
jgi:hypothetical protein